MVSSARGLLPFVVALTLLALQQEVPGEESAPFHKPVRLQADGKPIDTGEEWGHSGPALADVDGDGLRDLVVGDFSGKFRFYRNVGSNKEPQYAAAAYLLAGNVEAEVPIGCCIGSSPHFVDFDADGKLDFISGSYAPGECYLFRGLGGGKFASRETIVDKTGKPVIRRPQQQQEVESYGSWPVMVDWDNDGDLDLLVGTFGGTMFVRLNEGTRQKPVFAETNIPVQAGGKELIVPGERFGHAAVAVADWDHDGRWDLLSGSENGAVFFYRNIGGAGTPQFAAAQQLIAPHQGIGYEELLEFGVEPAAGIRKKIAAVDYNGDGKMDLLVGDFCTNQTPRPDLTPAQRTEMLRVWKQKNEVITRLRAAVQAFHDGYAKRYPGDALFSDEVNAEYEKAYQEFVKSKARTDESAKADELQTALNKFLLKPDNKGRHAEFESTHGYVWLFLRK